MFPVSAFAMIGKDKVGASPTNFNECVSQEQLQKVLEASQSGMQEMIGKTVTKTIIKLNIGHNIAQLNEKISTLVVTLKVWVANIPISDASKVITIIILILPMILTLRLSLQSHFFGPL